jgi:integrase
VPLLFKIYETIFYSTKASEDTVDVPLAGRMACRRKYCFRTSKANSQQVEKPKISTDNQITLHILRHLKGTMEYHRTKDILHVQQQLGHKDIKNTMIYTHLVDFSEDEYIAPQLRRNLKNWTC